MMLVPIQRDVLIGMQTHKELGNILCFQKWRCPILNIIAVDQHDCWISLGCLFCRCRIVGTKEWNIYISVMIQFSYVLMLVILPWSTSVHSQQWQLSMSFSSPKYTQLFSSSFMHNNIHIPLNADLQKEGPISELSVQSLYLLPPNGRVSRDLTLSRRFSQRPNVINGCHLRGVAGGWNRKEKVIQRRLLPTESNNWCHQISGSKRCPPLPRGHGRLPHNKNFNVTFKV